MIAPVPSNRAWTDNEAQSKLAAPATSRYAASRRSETKLNPVFIQIESDATGPDQAATESAATQDSGQVEEIAPNAAAVRGGRQEPDVTGQGPEVPGVIGQAFQLERDAANRLSPDRRAAAGQRLHRLAIGGGMTHRGVAGHLFGQVNAAFVGAADQGPLDPAMLVAQRNLQVKDLLAVALEAEVPRLDHAGMNGTDGDLVDLLPFDPEKIRDPDDRSLALPSAPRVVAGAIRAMKANRLEPGMPFGTDPVLLGKFPLEEVDLQTIGGERGKLVRVEPRLRRHVRAREGCRRGRRGRSTSSDELETSPNRAATRRPLRTASTTVRRKSANGTCWICSSGTACPILKDAVLLTVIIALPLKTRRPPAPANPADPGYTLQEVARAP